MPRLITKITKDAVFTFAYRVDLSVEEKNIIKRLDALEHGLTCGGDSITVHDLVNGERMEFSTITGVMDHERHVKTAAIALRDIIESLRSLGVERSVVL